MGRLGMTTSRRWGAGSARWLLVLMGEGARSALQRDPEVAAKPWFVASPFSGVTPVPDATLSFGTRPRSAGRSPVGVTSRNALRSGKDRPGPDSDRGRHSAGPVGRRTNRPCSIPDTMTVPEAKNG